MGRLIQSFFRGPAILLMLSLGLLSACDEKATLPVAASQPPVELVSHQAKTQAVSPPRAPRLDLKSAPAPQPSSEHLVVLYTTDIHGELLPCGCTTGPLGGFSYRHGLFQSVEAEGHSHLVLDAGNLLFGETLSTREERDRIKEGRLIFFLAEEQGLKAMAVGPTDLAVGGVTFLESLSSKEGAHILSINLLQGGVPVFETHTLFKVGGRAFAVFGVSGRLSPEQEKGGVKWADPVSLLAKEAAKLRPHVDMILVLSNMNAIDNRKLAEGVGAVDFILGGESDRFQEGHSRVEDQDGQPPFLLPLSGQGRFVGRLDLLMIPEPGARPVHDEAIAKNMRRQQVAKEGLESLKKRLMIEDGAIHPERLEKDGRLLTQQVADAEANLFKARTRPGFSYAPMPVLPTYSKDEAVAARIQDFLEETRGLDLKKAEAYRPSVSFTGNKGCRGCHPIQQAAWMGQAHAKAWDTLKSLGKEKDKSCLGCHTTGFGVAGGFFDVDNVKAQEGVGCEACHGPLSDHPKKRLFLQLTTRETCVRCHDASNSPGFDHVFSLPGVTCPAGVKLEAGLVGEIAPRQH